jgi:hypothetical protein
LVALTRLELNRGATLIAYVDRSVLASLRTRLHRATTDRGHHERCREDFVTVYFGSTPTREDRWYFDRSCDDENSRRLREIVDEIGRIAERPSRRQLGPLSCDELARNPPVLRIHGSTRTIELRDIDWWKLGSIAR